MLKKISTLVCIVALLGAASGCKSKARVRGIGLEAAFSDEKLSDNLITEVRYRWQTDAEFEKMNQDMNIFVHFWHKNNLILQDDHLPEVATSLWEAGKEYTYSRRIYIPPFIDEFDPSFKGEENLRISIGFYSPYDRSGESKQEVLVKNLKVYPPPLDTPEVIYEDGWYDLEIDPDAYLKQWRWMAKEARCIIDNPHRDALLVIRGGVNLQALPQQRVIIKINDLVLDDLVPTESYFEKSYNIKKEMLGEGEEFYLTVTTDKAFIPAKLFPDSTDQRELGVQISFIYFR